MGMISQILTMISRVRSNSELVIIYPETCDERGVVGAMGSSAVGEPAAIVG